ncbi:hypothetical protein HUT18_10635 [Streptomyces sp. NA04227]|uniref:hypothetical protein n=1 Tax=Streptomyces sp. NA04227 TaxID=2742136 RepID=UPI0015922AF3|nr:hypothetical protein [Streptomyces sp. NA04227]QKW06782.1 hypothetical protein HUT18_10635 [Streptomyces sp. NA04227]
MNDPTVWVLALFGLISLFLVMGTKLAKDFEDFCTAWIGAFRRLRERLRHGEDSRTPDEEEGADEGPGQGGGGRSPGP